MWFLTKNKTTIGPRIESLNWKKRKKMSTLITTKGPKARLTASEGKWGLPRGGGDWLDGRDRAQSNYNPHSISVLKHFGLMNFSCAFSSWLALQNNTPCHTFSRLITQSHQQSAWVIMKHLINVCYRASNVGHTLTMMRPNIWRGTQKSKKKWGGLWVEP